MEMKSETMKTIARQLRNNTTREENSLWYDFLRDYEVQWNRQYVIKQYVLDFYCRQVKLAVELDGKHHYYGETKLNDDERARFLNSIGVTVMRFTNGDVKHRFHHVCEQIDATVKQLHKPPSSEGGAERSKAGDVT